MADYYQQLGVSQSATSAEIKARYRLLCKKHHPDVGGSPEAMAAINQAYNVLSDPTRRASYNFELRAADELFDYSMAKKPVNKKNSLVWFVGGLASVVVGAVVVYFIITLPTPSSASSPVISPNPSQTAAQTPNATPDLTSSPTASNAPQPTPTNTTSQGTTGSVPSTNSTTSPQNTNTDSISSHISRLKHSFRSWWQGTE